MYPRRLDTCIGLVLGMILAGATAVAGETRQGPPLRVATFVVDATPPLGSPLCHGSVEPAKVIVDPLSARGIVLMGEASPIVLCAVDWVGIANSCHDAWREALAEAAGTTPDRVAVHALHQHDAPGCDFEAEALLAEQGLGGHMSDPAFVRTAIARAADAVREAMGRPVAVTHVGTGRAKVERVASNRRILGPDGKVQHVRFSSTQNEAAIAAPEGVIDPWVKLVSFWNGETPLASLTWYATHPQSFYRHGGVSTDFVGYARMLREATLPGVAHIHFTGAAGNVAAGKYNDGSPPRRYELANRLAEGMARAWEAVEKRPISAADIEWRVHPVALPPRDTLIEEELVATLGNAELPARNRIRAARNLTFLRRCHEGHEIDLACLRIGDTYVLHMPGELFVEYQLAAQEMRPDAMVCMAAYGEYGPGYIGTAISYGQGGYETGPPARVGPGSEDVLMAAIKSLLEPLPASAGNVD